MKVVLAEAAEADLEDIADFIAEDSPRRAASFTKELLNAAYRLADFPSAYPLVPRYEDRGIRRRPFGSYLIFYVVASDQITIVSILNSAQDYEAILFPENR